MVMRDRQSPASPPHLSEQLPQLGSLDPRRLSSVPPPPMVVVHKGWWGDRVTERPAADLVREGDERRKRA